MNTHSRRIGKFLLLLIATVAFSGLTSHAGSNGYSSERYSSDYSRFVVWRAADFGTDTSLYVTIDGQLVATLQRGQGYEAVIRPGSHSLTVSNTPSPYGRTKFTRQQFAFRRGETHAFTAIWDADNIVLKPSDSSAPPRRKVWY
jgi:hypothetical protein